MKVRVVIGLAACLVVSLAAGCQNTRGIVRGQTPSAAYEPPANSQQDRTYWSEDQPRGAFHGGHYHTFEYKAPQDLRYPDPNQPPPVTQYPYYTLRGPTDFFQK